MLRQSTLQDELARRLKIDNVFLAYDISGTFDTLHVRRPVRQEKPYKSMLSIMEQQVEDTYSLITGRMVGFWTPSYFDEVSVSGFHAHFLSDDLSIGGHVLDFDIKRGVLRYERKTAIRIVLPDTDDFLGLSLDIPEMPDIIRRIER